MSSEANIRDRVDQLADDLQKRLFDIERGTVLYDPENSVEYEVVDYAVTLGDDPSVKYILHDYIMQENKPEGVAKVHQRFEEIPACPECGVVGCLHRGSICCFNADCDIDEYGGENDREESTRTGDQR